MKRHSFALALVLFVFGSTFGQSKSKYLYLTVEIVSRLDWDQETYYWSLATEHDNPNASFLDTLITYKAKLRKDSSIGFYNWGSGKSAKLFNYFKTTSECLSFLDANGWELFQVLGDTRGSTGSVSTDRVYYLRKQNL